MANWTKADYDRLMKKREPNKKASKDLKPKKQEKYSAEKDHIWQMLQVLKFQNKIKDYETELKFHKKRRFRFDWAITELKIAIEYEGIVSKKSRHTNITGYTNDCIKYNLAVGDGWRVLRYTALNYKNVYDDIIKLIEHEKE